MRELRKTIPAIAALQNEVLTRSLRRMASAKPSALLDTRAIYCGDNLEQIRKLPPAFMEFLGRNISEL